MVPGAIVLLLSIHAAYAQNFWISSQCPPDADIKLPHEEDCTKYYLCTNGQRVLKECPEETSFHVGLQGCEWSQDISCHKDTTTFEAPRLLELLSKRLRKSNGCPSDYSVELLLPHETDCGKYYQCTHGQKVEKPCPDTLHFDQSAQTCTYPDIAKCKVPPPNNETTTIIPETTKIPSTTEAIKPTTEALKPTTAKTTTIGIQFLPNGCPIDIYTYFLIPHETDCTLYYQCNHGKKEVKECPKDLHFDFVLQGCNWSNIAKCKLSMPTTTRKPETTEPTLTTKNDFLPNGCPVDIHVHHLLPHETDCTKFYQCTHGKTVLKDCPSGLHFDNVHQICNWPNAANCEIQPTTIRTTEKDVPTTTSSLPTTVTETETTLTTKIEYTSTTSSPEVTTQTTVTNPITTIAPTTTAKTEPTTIKVDATTSTDIDNISNGQELETQTEVLPMTTESITSTEENNEIEGEGTEAISNPTSTNEPTTHKPTTIVTEPTIITTEVTQKPNVTPEPSPCLPGYFGNMAHPELCNAYYLCSAGLAIPLFCPNGYEFDPDVKICIPIKEGGCTLGSDLVFTTTDPFTEDSNNIDHVETTPAFIPTETEDITTEELTSEVSTTIDYETDNLETTTQVNIIATYSPGEPPIICQPGVIDVLPNPEQCNSYYMCFGGSALIMHCPVGQEFDINSKSCVPIQNGGCTLGGLQPTTATPSTTTEAEVIDFTPAEIVTRPTTTTVDTTTSTTTTTTSKPTAPSVCPPGAIANVPNPDTCNVYYLCTGGMAIGPLYCPTGQEFDADSKVCIPIKEGGCTLPWSPTEETSTETDSVDDTITEPSESEYVTGPPNNPGLPGAPAIPDITSEPETTTFEITTDAITTTALPTTIEVDTLPTTEIIEETTETLTTTTTLKVPTTTTVKVPTTTTTVKVPTTTTTVKVPTTTTTVKVPTTTTTVKVPTTTTTVLPTTTESETPATLCPPVAIVNVPHPEICDAYYLCFGGSAIAMYCPPGQEFDPITKACVIIKESGCTYSNSAFTTRVPTTEKSNSKEEDAITTRPTTKKPATTKKPSTTKQPKTTTTKEPKTTTVGPQSATAICGPTDFGHKPHPEMCNVFYMCTGGTAIPLLCAEGLEFDQTTGLCEEIKEGGCTYNLSSALLLTTENQTTTDSVSTKFSELTKKIIRGICNVTDFGYVPHPEKCDAYYMCTGGIAVPLKCQKGYEFNYNTKKCVLITTGGCFARKFFYKRMPHFKRQTLILNRWHQQ